MRKYSENIEIQNKQQIKVFRWKYEQSKNENADRERFAIANNPRKEKKREKKTSSIGETSLLRR